MAENSASSENRPSEWTVDQIPDQSGRTAVVTGANSGLGFETAKALVGRGANLVLACRSASKAEAAIDAIRREEPAGKVEFFALDLASLASIRDFAKRVTDRYPQIHLLVNNAGVMAIPQRKTEDGFEMQLGTNHLGHFALTGLLLDSIAAADGSRVVNVSSTMHKIGRMHFDDIHFDKGYSRWPAYGQSKLANLLFTFELQRRFDAAGVATLTAASHPGYAATNLQFEGPRMDGSGLMKRAMGVTNRIFSQSAAMGALPSLYAATAPDVRGADYFGPGGFMELMGHPVRVDSNRKSKSLEDAARLWDVSVASTGVHYEALEH